MPGGLQLAYPDHRSNQHAACSGVDPVVFATQAPSSTLAPTPSPCTSSHQPDQSDSLTCAGSGYPGAGCQPDAGSPALHAHPRPRMAGRDCPSSRSSATRCWKSTAAGRSWATTQRSSPRSATAAAPRPGSWAISTVVRAIYRLGEYQHLAEVIQQFHGSFDRTSLAAPLGFQCLGAVRPDLGRSQLLRGG